jgi:predicted regulator of Ras-like GTPase activity (Roadblock/LC7/MglB family)
MPTKTEQLKTVLGQLRLVQGVEGSILLSRDGITVVHDLPPAYDRDTFSAMSAAMLAAAETAMIEIGRGTPDKVTLENKTTKIVSTGVTGEMMLVVLMAAGADAAGLNGQLGQTVEAIRRTVSN